MHALRFHAVKDIRLDEVAEPQADAGQLKIRVEAAGICGSDIHEYLGGPISIPVDHPHPLTHESAPVILGHEFCGTIVDVGAGVMGFEVGQRVAANAALWCGHCRPCDDGMTNVCEQIGFHGLSGGGGAFASFDVIGARNAHRIPDDMPAEVGALLEPLATGIHAVGVSGVRVGDAAVVFGAGPIGLMVISALTEVGLSAIITVEPSPSRAALATTFGATHVINPFKADVVAAVAEVVGSGRVGAAFDAAAAPDSLTQAIAVTSARGRVVNLAAWERPVEFNPTSLLYREVSIHGSLAYTSADFEAAIAHATSRQSELSSVITSRIPLSAIVSEGFEKLATRGHDEVKVMVTP